MRYVLTSPAGYDIARADRPEILVDAAVARLTATDHPWRDEDEWRVWYETANPAGEHPRRKLRYGVSVRYGVYRIDGSGVPATVAATLPMYLSAPPGPTGGDPKDPLYDGIEGATS